jgi:hypothetical protein
LFDRFRLQGCIPRRAALREASGRGDRRIAIFYLPRTEDEVDHHGQ